MSTDGLLRGGARAPDEAPDPGVPQAPEHAETDGGERGRLIQAMESAGWVQARAARLLGITARQIGYALRKHDIPIKKF
jgi:Nif-specific regulatory protein